MTDLTNEQRADLKQAAKNYVAAVDHWYWAEREVCGFGTHTEPPCVKDVGHADGHDGYYEANAWERQQAYEATRSTT